jgi:UDP-N-acetylmuramoyl-tripeptide--D-alanyl-D-alanine ligase
MVILGEMKELGDVSDEEHRKMVQFLREQYYDSVYLVGSVFKNQTDAGDVFHLFEDIDELIVMLEKEPVSDHYILLKGSHSIHLEKAVSYL